MLMQAAAAEVHRDWRNERGTVNYTMHVQGEVQLWVVPESSGAKGGGKPPTPTWDPSETRVLTETPCSTPSPRGPYAAELVDSGLYASRHHQT